MIHPAHTHAPELVLLIERDASLREVLRAAFEDEGYRVRLAARPPTAAEVARLQPDLLVIDIERHDAEAGWRFVEEIKAEPRLTHLPVVVCSGDGAIVAQQEVRVRSEAAAILVKPFSLDDLLPVVSTALARREMFHAVHQLVAEPSTSHSLGSIGF